VLFRSITLAIGVTRMARRKAIVRRLPAVETLGAVGVICSDKTGTLTRNELTVRTVVTAEERLEVTGTGWAPRGQFVRGEAEIAVDQPPQLLELSRAALLCCDASLHEKDGEGWVLQGDPTDGALVCMAMKAGLDPRHEAAELSRRDVIPFESEHRYMATLHHDHRGHARIFVKGAPEQLLAMCGRERHADGSAAPLDERAWRRRVDALAAAGQRVIAVATREATPGKGELAFDDVQGLTLLGLLVLIDPPREEAVAAVREELGAGIAVKMITGDHVVTARAIGEQFGISGQGGALEGRQLDTLTDEQLRRAARETAVFARASPEHKLRLVKALQADGQVVAMTGDGVNDAPALKRADVGVAMGIKGTEAAKEAAAMVLADDNFASIAHAVEEGRTVYDNIRKAMLFILPTNGAQALVVLVAVLAGMTLPITPVQILWVNMVSAVTLGLALAFEPPEPDVMRRPPRGEGERLMNGLMLWRVCLVMLLLVAGAFGLFLWSQARGEPLAASRAVAVNAIVVGEIFYLCNSRSVVGPVLNVRGFFGSRAVLISIAVVLALQLLFTYAPVMNSLFGTAPFGALEWAVMAGVGVVILLLVELEKLLLRRVGRLQRMLGMPPIHRERRAST
jgi:magnesium-transporting ATPase (P-type)